MDCETCREVVSAGLDGEAGQAERAAADEHLAACAACRAHHDGLHVLHRRLRLQPADAVPDLAARILGTLPDGVVGAPSRRARRRPALAVLAAAAVVLVAGAVLAVVERADDPTADLSALVEVSDAFATPASQGGLSSVYLTLRNRGGAEDALVQVDAADADEVELHATVTTGSGRQVMRSVDQFPLGAGTSGSTRSGASHLMLVDVARPLRPGDVLVLVLHFGHAPEVRLQAPVVDLATAAVRSSIGAG